MLTCRVGRNHAKGGLSRIRYFTPTFFVCFPVLGFLEGEPFLETKGVPHIEYMSRLVDFFDRYTSEHGWKIIPVHPRSKIPVGIGWNGRYNRWRSRHYVYTHPDVNLGVLLGDFVDVEGDTPKANAFLNDLLRGYAHPSYESNKSVHHLFRTPDHELTALRHQDIEFRGHLHFSVLPPSLHTEGGAYKWLTEPTKEMPEMPLGLLDFYRQHRRQSSELKPGFVKPRCSKCECEQVIHRKRYVLEVRAFRHCGLVWECRGCRKVDVRNVCRHIRKSDRYIH